MEDKDKQGEKKWYILDRGSLSLLIVLLAAILFYVGLTNFDVIAVPGAHIYGCADALYCRFCYRLSAQYAHVLLSESSTKAEAPAWAGDSDVYLIALAIVVVLLNLIIPQVAQSVVDLATNMQTYLTSLNSLVQTLSEQFGLDGGGPE